MLRFLFKNMQHTRKQNRIASRIETRREAKVQEFQKIK